MKPMLSIFNLRSTLNTDFWLCFKVFFSLIYEFCFHKLALPPLNKRFKICLMIFESIPVQKTVSEVLKRGSFRIRRFVRQANDNEGDYTPRP